MTPFCALPASHARAMAVMSMDFSDPVDFGTVVVTEPEDVIAGPGYLTLFDVAKPQAVLTLPSLQPPVIRETLTFGSVPNDPHELVPILTTNSALSIETTPPNGISAKSSTARLR